MWLFDFPEEPPILLFFSPSTSGESGTVLLPCSAHDLKNKRIAARYSLGADKNNMDIYERTVNI